MTDCSVRWRPSGGRGEYEYVPANALEDREILVSFEPLGLTIPAEVRGVNAVAQGKPRLRKFDKNNRQKLHLPPLVAAVARLPEPRREDITGTVVFPLENKGYVLDEIEFEIAEDDGERTTLVPLRMTVQHSNFTIDLSDRVAAIASDWAHINAITAKYPLLGAAIAAHATEVKKGVNSSAIRAAADEVIRLQGQVFGASNFGAITSLANATAAPASETEAEFYELENYSAKEGRTLIRVHAHKERDRGLVKRAKQYYRKKWGGSLKCESCDTDPQVLYGARGDSCIEAHHRTPISQLLPDSVTTVADLAMLCASCHRVLHSAKPILAIDEVVPNKSAF
ncbi:MAG TPA: hypothetical protein VF702_01290 [Allosphingosinicella sp.]|jgi:hypothetical protein